MSTLWQAYIDTDQGIIASVVFLEEIIIIGSRVEYNV